MSNPGKLCLFNGHRLSTAKFLKHNSQNNESLGEEAASSGAEQPQKSCCPLSERESKDSLSKEMENQKTGILTQQMDA